MIRIRGITHRHIFSFAAVALFGAACAKENATTKSASAPSQSSPAAAQAQQSASQTSDAGQAPTGVQESLGSKQLKVFYFHTTQRCYSCNTIEKLTKEAISESFANELRSGAMVFESINIEEKPNEHYAQDYKLYTKSVIVSSVVNEKEAQWKNLDQVWTLLRDPAKFKAYVVQEINAYLKG